MSDIAETIIKLHSELPPEVTLVAVSKFHPAEAVMEAYSAGQRVFGESRPQELSSKVKTLAEKASEAGNPALYSDIRWHFIGHLQTNKLKMVLPYVSMVESVDSLHLLEAIDRWGGEHGRTVDVLLEYHIASEDTKQGFDADGIREILFSGHGYRNVNIRGLMGMATFTDDEKVIRADFSRLVSLRDSLIPEAGKHPDLPASFGLLSFGMTHDYKIAVSMGADIVSIGTLIFGERDYR